MHHILSAKNLHVLEAFALSNTLAAFDYDGTLAPIVRDPSKAILRATTRRLLAALARLCPCVVISGRARADALRFVDGVPVRDVIGNDGIEPGQRPEHFERAVRGWLPIVAKRLASCQGVVIEDKQFSLALHYRRSREKKKARSDIVRTASRLGKVRVILGKQVINVVPDGAPHKGIALLEAREEQMCDTAIYVGDDASDEDVFALNQPGQLLTIRVGGNAQSHAQYFLRNQREVDALLRALVSLRRRRKEEAIQQP